MKQNRYQSPVFWGSVIVAVVGILATFGVLTDDIAAKIVGAVGTLIAVVYGAANNPTNKKGF